MRLVSARGAAALATANSRIAAARACEAYQRAQYRGAR
jgi:hypothetical protein